MPAKDTLLLYGQIPDELTRLITVFITSVSAVNEEDDDDDDDDDDDFQYLQPAKLLTQA